MPIKYTIKQGDCLDSVAFTHGFFPGTIWNQGDNAALREKRKDPNVLYPGDVLVIPDKRVDPYEAPVDNHYKFRRKGIPKLLSVQVKRPSGSPYKNKPYELVVDGGPARKDDTDGDGWIRQYIAPNAREAKLTVAGVVQIFDLGRLDPVAETSGVQGRLRALGYHHGAVDGKAGDDTVAAIKSFQLANDLKVTGEIDDDTKKRLVEEIGS